MHIYNDGILMKTLHWFLWWFGIEFMKWWNFFSVYALFCRDSVMKNSRYKWKWYFRIVWKGVYTISSGENLMFTDFVSFLNAAFFIHFIAKTTICPHPSSNPMKFQKIYRIWLCFVVYRLNFFLIQSSEHIPFLVIANELHHW